MKNKKFIMYTVIVGLMLTLGVSYAYFTGVITEVGKKILIRAKDLKIILTDNMQIANTVIEPGWNESKTFTIKNESDNIYNYNIVIKDLVNTFTTVGFLQYKITSTNGYNTEGYIDIPKSSEAKDTIIGYDIDIPKDTAQEYTIEFIYHNSEEDQSEDMGMIFSGILAIVEGSIDPNKYYSVEVELEHGTITSENPQESLKNGTLRFNYVMEQGYNAGTVTCDSGATGKVENNEIIISNITSNNKCIVSNEIKKYIVSVTSNNNSYGTISPMNQHVIHGSNAEIILNPASGYKYVSDTCGGTVNGNTMIISNVTGDKSCVVTFEKEKPTLYAQILEDHPTVLTRSSFDEVLGSSISTTNTIYYTDKANENETGIAGDRIYYFAGNVADNWVKFANVYWRIIRTNEDGSVRLLYAGTSPNTTSGYLSIMAYNDKYNSPTYVNWINSNLNDQDKENSAAYWYANLSSTYKNLISTTAIYCNDASYTSSQGNLIYGATTRLQTNKTPTFKCPSTSYEFKQGYGLMTADEPVYI